MARVRFVGVNKIHCGIDLDGFRLLYCGCKDCSVGVVELTVVFEFNDELRELYGEYCRLYREYRRVLRENWELVRNIAEKYGGEWSATLKDGRVIIRKGWFRKKNVEVWDDKLSPRLLQLMHEEKRIDKRLKEIEEALKEHILNILNKTIR